MAKQKLTPIPKRAVPAKPAAAKQRTPPRGGSGTAPIGTGRADLSHIAEGLRPLAFPTADLAFMVGNPLSHPEEQVEDLKASLRQFGQVEALLVNRRQTPPVVIGGNGRLQAMLALGWTHAACVFVDFDDAKANALAVVLNRSREGAKWDKDALGKLLQDVNTCNDERLDAMLADLAADVGITPKDPKPDTPPAAVKATLKCPHCGGEFESP